MVLHGEQIRAARSLLGWSQAELAKKADVAHMTVRRLEARDGPVRGTVDSLVRVQSALEQAGIEFIGGPGDGLGIRLWKKPRAP